MRRRRRRLRRRPVPHACWSARRSDRYAQSLLRDPILTHDTLSSLGPFRMLVGATLAPFAAALAKGFLLLLPLLATAQVV